MVDENQDSSKGELNGSKIRVTKAVEEEEEKEEEKAEEKAEEQAEESGGNETQALTQTETSNISRQAYRDFVEHLDPPYSPGGGNASNGDGKTPRKSNVTLAMEDDDADADVDADESSVHTEDDLEAGVEEAPGSAIAPTKTGGYGRQVSFHETCDRPSPSTQDSLKGLSSDNNSDSMTSMESETVGQIKAASEALVHDEQGNPLLQSSRSMVKNRKRISLVVDIESGKEGARAQKALVRVWNFACR
jgi:hypothetical protein